MISISAESSGNVLLLAAQGKLTDRDYREILIPRLQAIMREHGKARVLFDMGDEFHGWEPAAAWDQHAPQGGTVSFCDGHAGVLHQPRGQKPRYGTTVHPTASQARIAQAVWPAILNNQCPSPPAAATPGNPGQTACLAPRF